MILWKGCETKACDLNSLYLYATEEVTHIIRYGIKQMQIKM